MTINCCIITTVHPAFDPRIFHKQAVSLARANHRVSLIAPHDKSENVSGAEIIPLGKPKNRAERMARAVTAFRLALKKRADVYHFHDPELLLVGVFLRIFSRKAVTYDVHENVREQILNKTWIPRLFRKAVSRIYVSLERICLLFFDAVIIAEDSYAKNYGDRPPLVPIRNYPILSFVKEALARRPGRPRPQTGPNLVYVGQLTELRGVFEMIEAAGILKANGYPNLVLKLAGRFMPPGLEGEVRRRISEKGLTKNVELLGVISHDQAFLVMADADIGLTVLHPDPNYLESIPTKLFEYMSVGIPVVSSNFPICREIVEGNECGYCVEPKNPESLAIAIERLLKDPETAKEMGKRGQAAVFQKYSWETESLRFLSLYKDVVSKISRQ